MECRTWTHWHVIGWLKYACISDPLENISLVEKISYLMNRMRRISWHCLQKITNFELLSNRSFQARL